MVECGGLENRWASRSRGFESLPLRHFLLSHDLASYQFVPLINGLMSQDISLRLVLSLQISYTVLVDLLGDRGYAETQRKEG